MSRWVLHNFFVLDGTLVTIGLALDINLRIKKLQLSPKHHFDH